MQMQPHATEMSTEIGEGLYHSSEPSKAVYIAEPESITPISSSRLDGHISLQRSVQGRQHRATITRRLPGRPPLTASTSSLQSNTSGGSFVARASSDPRNLEDEGLKGQSHHLRHHSYHHRQSSYILSQVVEWLLHEKAKKAKRKSKQEGVHSKLTGAFDNLKTALGTGRGDAAIDDQHRLRRTASNKSDGSIDLDSLEKILGGVGLGEDIPNDEKMGSYFSRRSSVKHKLLRKHSISSDTEYVDGDVVVPAAEVVLDNSKTLSFSGGIAGSQTSLLNPNKRALKEKEAWSRFKNEIVRLTHTLKLKGWRQVPLDSGGDIEVERLSGALTNAVYVVSPPANLQQPTAHVAPASGKAPSQPPKLLLRIYGPQVQHLIDREKELQILRRLRRKRIGPCLLGTFANGRFEEYYNARTLTAPDLRIPQTSKQIAKRMRELHDGVELLEEEREAGPFVWLNWDRWVEKCEEIVTWLDDQIISGKQGAVRSRSERWKERGFVCGVAWADFRRTVERYRRWLDQQYEEGAASIKHQLVFAHNDTQYGNLLRLQPPGDSPLLTPANEHKQLVVIDFEYASANVPGIEFANHFTEWCYNYHDPERPHALNPIKYPTPAEQRRFLKAYLQHRPFEAYTSTPTLGTSSSASSFVLDNRAPPAQYADEERIRDQAVEAEINRLMHEVRIWRLANSAQWVAWGIVQAKVPGLDVGLKAQKGDTPQVASEHCNESSSQEHGNEAEEEEEEEEGAFDYLAYAQERSMFFWGDALQMGIVKREDLPAPLLEKIKVVEY